MAVAHGSSILRLALLAMLFISVIPVVLLLVALTTIRPGVPCVGITDMVVLHRTVNFWRDGCPFRRERRQWQPARLAAGEKCEASVVDPTPLQPLGRDLLQEGPQGSLESAGTAPIHSALQKDTGSSAVSVDPSKAGIKGAVPSSKDSASSGLRADGDGEVGRRAKVLMQKWSQLHGLSKLHPPSCVDMASSPRAPHLEECTATTALRTKSEAQESQGSGYPGWACARRTSARGKRPGKGLRTTFCDSPNPPWVIGADDDNLPLTRRVQRDLWVRQFPAGNCSDPSLRFLLVDWWSMYNHGIGSQLHLMSAAFSLAYATGRVLVPVPRTFHRANHRGCEREGHRGSLDCYFFPVTSRQCVAQAWSLYKATKPQDLSFQEVSVKTLNVSARVLRIYRPIEGQGWVQEARWNHYLEATAALAWGRPWANQISPFEILGRTLTTYNDSLAQANWWRSQSMRFMLRWPSAYLCHIMNRVRHESYGLSAAEQVARAAMARESLERSRDKFLDPMEPYRLRETPERDFGPAGEPLELTAQWRFRAEPYLPRPMISIHVRQGDKAKEMKLFSLPSYMWLAERVRLLVPHIQYIWLSTEMQSIVDDTANYKDWRFFFTRMKRQVGNTSMISYEKEVGMEQEVGSSFANLIIASQCDFFVGVLGSNWNRLINELRLTNGRRRSSYMTLNNAEW